MIIITTYHNKGEGAKSNIRKEYLETTIKSVDSQRIENLFHLIVDDGGADGYYEILKARYVGSTNRVVIRREKPAGEILSSTNARNFGLEYCFAGSVEGVDISRHDVITFIDSDDVVINLDRRFEEMYSKNIDLLYTDALLFFNESERAYFWKGMSGGLSRIINNFWVMGKMPYPTMTFRRDFLVGLRNYNKKKYAIDGVFNPNIGCGEDVEFALASFEYAKLVNAKAGYLPEITAGYRLHELSIASIRNQKQRILEENSVIIRHFGKTKSIYLHIKRFIIRPECYFPSLMSIKNTFRASTYKSKYIPAKYSLPFV